jgi:hypothetical protein
MFSSVGDDAGLEFMLNLKDIILDPLLTLRLHLLVRIHFHFIFTCKYKLLLYIVLLRELMIPQLAPNCSHVANHREVILIGVGLLA